MAKKKPAMIKRTVRITVDVDVSFDPSIMPDDDWRKHFYGYVKTHDDLAAFLARNHVISGDGRLSRIDGFADRQDSQASCRMADVETEIV